MSGSAACPVCGFGELDTRQYIVPGSTVGEVAVQYFATRKKKRCQRCYTGFVDPDFPPHELSEYYTKAYWQDHHNMVNVAGLDFTRAKQHYIFLFDVIENAKTILDYGCGRGQFSVYIKRLFPEKTVLATDRSPIAAVYVEYEGVEFVPEIDQCKGVDLLYSSHSLEHVPNINESMEQFLAATADSAFLFFEVPNVENFYLFEKCNHMPHTYMFCLESFKHLAARFKLEWVKSDVFGSTWAQKLRTQDAEAMHPSVLRVLLKKGA